MLLIMGVSLYTSRVILYTLGVDDYGIYNLIAGFITLFSFISTALVSAMQRYFNVAIGEGDGAKFSRYFSMSFNILFLFSIVILILGETIGLWFVLNKLNIPTERSVAAFWTYQLALATFIANILRTPCNAAIIANERMSFYAYISIAEVVLRLAVVLGLSFFEWDKLILYSILYFLLIVLITLFYRIYCKKKLKNCSYRFFWDKKLFKELLGFSGWSLMGQSSVVISNQGQAIFINQFFTVAANAAMGIAGQLTNAIDQFVINFQTAFTPQITQTYATKDYDQHYILLFRASKFSFYLLLVLMLPVCFNIETILNIWLEEIPEYTDRFCVSILISYLFAAYSCPFTTSIYATGNIKRYEIQHTVVFLVSLVLSYIALFFGCKPYVIADISIIVQVAMLIVRLSNARKYAKVDIIQYVKTVIQPTFFVSIFSIIVSYLIHLIDADTLMCIFIIIINAIIIALITFFIGLDRNERNYVFSLVKRK